jgi:HSP20 family molecular chaperone IbpA
MREDQKIGGFTPIHPKEGELASMKIHPTSYTRPEDVALPSPWDSDTEDCLCRAEALWKDLNRGFDALFSDRARATPLFPLMPESPCFQEETPEEYRLTIPLPGVSKDGLKIECYPETGKMVITWEAPYHFPGDKPPDEDEKTKVIRPTQRGRRTFVFPRLLVNFEETMLFRTNGMVYIKVPKRPKEEKKIQVLEVQEQNVNDSPA